MNTSLILKRYKSYDWSALGLKHKLVLTANFFLPWCEHQQTGFASCTSLALQEAGQILLEMRSWETFRNRLINHPPVSVMIEKLVYIWLCYKSGIYYVIWEMLYLSHLWFSWTEKLQSIFLWLPGSPVMMVMTTFSHIKKAHIRYSLNQLYYN